MKTKTIGKAYLLREDTYSDSGKLLGKGYAVVLKKYDVLSRRALVSFDDSSYWIDPSYLQEIEGDAPEHMEKPAHYESSIDPIDFMRANVPPAELRGFLRGNVLKYISRFDKKNGVEDLRKCRHYLDMLIEELEEEK